MKSLLSAFGEVTRIYLVEERKKGKRKRYTEGWAEFEKRSIAKHVAKSLNNTPISNYKRSHHYGELWNLKFLKNFHWSHLTEKVAYERRVREQKLRLEFIQARKENSKYAALVEKGETIGKKRKFNQSEEKTRYIPQVKPIQADEKALQKP